MASEPFFVLFPFAPHSPPPFFFLVEWHCVLVRPKKKVLAAGEAKLLSDDFSQLVGVAARCRRQGGKRVDIIVDNVSFLFFVCLRVSLHMSKDFD